MNSFLKHEILFFGFIVTRPTTLSFGKLEKEHFRIEF
jgi:hypothetical protein